MATKKEEHELLYHELPSIEPRVSRQERLSQQRHCYHCEPDHLKRAKQSVRYSYFFFLGLLVLSYAVYQYSNFRSEDNLSIPESSKMISYSFSHKAQITLVQSTYRHGIVVLFRNNGFSTWNIQEVLLTIKNSDFQQSFVVNESIKSKAFISVFISIPKEYQNIDDIILEIP